MIRRLFILLILISPVRLFGSGLIRVNQLGYSSGAYKVAVFLSDKDVFAGKFQIISSLSGEVDFESAQERADASVWNQQTACRFDSSLPGPEGQQTNNQYIKDTQGAVVRMDTTSRKVYLIFSAHDLKEGGQTIISALKRHNVKASFFLTGEFYADPENHSFLGQLIKDGHFLGAHSDRHLLYADWSKRDSLLISREQFESDLKENYRKMSACGIAVESVKFFLPPYEWYNQSITDWAGQLGLTLINFTPGIRTNADYTTPEMSGYLSSDAIMENLKKFEKNDPHRLNGCIVLIHLGTSAKRTDKFYNRLDELITLMKKKNYQLDRLW